MAKQKGHLVKTTPVSSIELMRRYNGGDKSAFDELKRRHGNTIGMYAIRFIDVDDAALVVMSACFSVLKRDRSKIQDPVLFLQQTAKQVIEFILSENPPVETHSKLWLEMRRSIPESFDSMNLDNDLLASLKEDELEG